MQAFSELVICGETIILTKTLTKKKKNENSNLDEFFSHHLG